MRIALLGRPGAGKTTFAHKLSRALGMPLHHVDKYFFEANWVPTSAEKFNAWQQRILAQKEWIIEGNGTRYLVPRATAADLVIVFNLPRWLCTWRVLKRRLIGSRFHDQPTDCPNRITWNLLWYLWYKFDKHLQNRLYAHHASFGSTTIIEVRSDHEAAALLEQLTTQQ